MRSPSRTSTPGAARGERAAGSQESPRGMRRTIQEQGLNAEAAVTQVLDEWEERLLALDTAYIRERASDFGEVKRRLLDATAHYEVRRICICGFLSIARHCKRV